MPLISSIPEDFREGFKELAEISDSNFSSFLEALAKVEHYPNLENLSEAIEVENDELDFDVKEIIDSIGSLQMSLDSNDKDIISEVIEDVTFLAEELGLLKTESKDVFKRRLAALLDVEKIYYAAKADSLLNNYGNSYIQARILSDIRPIFDLGDAEEIPKAGLILHNLTIHYNSNEEPFHKDITLSLTSYGIKDLISVLNRAEKKEISLRKLLEKVEMKNLND